MYHRSTEIPLESLLDVQKTLHQCAVPTTAIATTKLRPWSNRGNHFIYSATCNNPGTIESVIWGYWSFCSMTGGLIWTLTRYRNHRRIHRHQRKPTFRYHHQLHRKSSYRWNTFWMNSLGSKHPHWRSETRTRCPLNPLYHPKYPIKSVAICTAMSRFIGNIVSSHQV